MYLKDVGFRDFGWQLMYTPSASRWFDNYIGVGAEHDRSDAPTPGAAQPAAWNFVMETGFKFRVNVTKTPIKFLKIFTDFWGFRVGIKNVGFPDLNRITYVLEFGAGSF